jgi:hypothetical protein
MRSLSPYLSLEFKAHICMKVRDMLPKEGEPHLGKDDQLVDLRNKRCAFCLNGEYLANECGDEYAFAVSLIPHLSLLSAAQIGDLVIDVIMKVRQLEDDGK